MSYYKKLNLPMNPFKDWNSIYEQIKEKFPKGQEMPTYHAILDPQGLLTQELESILASINVKVINVVLFCRGDTISFAEKRIIHSDISWNEKKKTWEDIHCGINWELSGSNLFTWWDMSKTKAVYPFPPYRGVNTDGPIINLDSAKLNGIHYDSRLKGGIHKNAVKFDETKIDGPTLVRTDIPHNTVYMDFKVRIGISLRIDETELNSWEKIVERFKPLCKDQ